MMGCASAKQLSSVPGDEDDRDKAHSNGDAFSSGREHLSLSLTHTVSFLTDVTDQRVRYDTIGQ